MPNKISFFIMLSFSFWGESAHLLEFSISHVGKIAILKQEILQNKEIFLTDILTVLRRARIMKVL